MAEETTTWLSVPQAVKMTTQDSRNQRNHRNRKNQLTISEQTMFSCLQLFKSPIKSRWKRTCLLQVFPGWQVIMCIFVDLKLKSLSCLTRETRLKTYFPLLLPMPSFIRTWLGFGQVMSLRLLLTLYFLVAVMLPLLHCHNTLAA